MKVAVFPGIDGNASIDRYARELAAHAPPGVEAEIIAFQKSPGMKGVFCERYLKYFQMARKTKADCNIIGSESYTFLILGLRPERTIVICHDLHPLIYRGWTGTYRFRYKMNLRLLPLSRAIVAVSEHTKKDLLKYCPFIPPEKVFSIHNGLERKWRRIENQARLDQVRHNYNLEGKKIILHVGNDNWYKNFSTLVHAFAGMNDPTLVLIKVGDCGSVNRELVGRLGIADRFVHVRGIDDEELMSLYSIAEVMVFPSLHEGFGWPPLEAMACGCPVITTRKASLPEVCGDACMYVEPRDVDGITAAICKLREYPDLRANLVKYGLSQVQKFDWRQTAQAILQLLG
jgi:glycosyltransferase involved in cell wall biosynthesis